MPASAPTPVASACRCRAGRRSSSITPRAAWPPGTAPAFEREARLFREWLHQGRPAPGFDKVRIAGDPEREMRRKREKDGIPVDRNTWEEIQAAGVKLKLARETVQRLAEGR